MLPTKCGAARSCALGAHAKPLGDSADGLAGQARARASRSCLPQEASMTWCKPGVRRRRRPRGFSRHIRSRPLTCVAYFSMEFMLSEALPIYSGGLGNVAGDQLKAASDLGVPVVGVGLLYQQGYFRQVIDKDGRNRPSSRTTTLDSCRSRRCANRTANGCGWRSPCPVTRSGCAPGRSRLAE